MAIVNGVLLKTLIGDYLLLKVFGLREVLHPATGLFFIANDGSRDRTDIELQAIDEGFGTVALPLEDAEMISVENVHIELLQLEIVLVVFSPFLSELFGDRGGFVIGEGACDFLPPRFICGEGSGGKGLKEGFDLDEFLFESSNPIDELLCGHREFLPAYA